MKLIAFYLPQFHTFPENDEWWEKDFTEWTNVKRAMKLYSWQYQPRIPYKNNYYNLNDDFEATMKWQIEIAKRGGVYGFCFYHYWFKNGKRLLEKPVERFLENENLDINFCLSWANEPWTRTWDGKQHDILMPQEYGDVDEWKDNFTVLDVEKEFATPVKKYDSGVGTATVSVTFDLADKVEVGVGYSVETDGESTTTGKITYKL